MPTDTLAPPGTMPPVSPLSQVLQLLDQATDLKLLRHSSRAALELLTEADELCDAEPDLPRAIRGLVAYRMGHLRMRQGSGVDTLLAADQDFLRACRMGEGLEPWAGLYRLAVLGRLMALAPSPAIPASIQQRLDDQWQEVIRQQAILDPTRVPERDDPIVQRGSFNAAEALAYALGLNLSLMEGLGALPYDLHTGQEWGCLVGLGLETTHARVPWATLTHLLMQLREKQPEALYFSLPAPAHPPLLWRPGQDRPEPLGRRQAQLIGWVLRACPGGTDGLEHAAWGRPVSPATRRKLIQRARETLTAMTGLPGTVALRRGPDDALALAPEIAIYGVIHGESSHRS